MTTYDHNQVCTTDNMIEVGKEYDYYEDGCVARVVILSDDSTDGAVGFHVKVTQEGRGFPLGTEFAPWATAGKYGYSGMWRLYDADTYIRLPLASMTGEPK